MTLIQFPNKLLWIMIASWLVSHFSTGYVYAFSRSIFIASGIIWSYEELIHGINWFRKLLGLAVMLVFILGLVMEIKQ